jgi:hypothetical protein
LDDSGNLALGTTGRDGKGRTGVVRAVGIGRLVEVGALAKELIAVVADVGVDLIASGFGTGQGPIG